MSSAWSVARSLTPKSSTTWRLRIPLKQKAFRTILKPWLTRSGPRIRHDRGQTAVSSCRINSRSRTISTRFCACLESLGAGNAELVNEGFCPAVSSAIRPRRNWQRSVLDWTTSAVYQVARSVSTLQPNFRGILRPFPLFGRPTDSALPEFLGIIPRIPDQPSPLIE